MICDLFNDFFTDYRIIPKKSMSISEQINCVIKILMLLFILCLLSDLNMEVYIILLFIIIILFYIKGNAMNQKENFIYTYPQQNANYISKNTRKTRNLKGVNMPDTVDYTVHNRAQSISNNDIIENVNYNPFAYDTVEQQVNDSEYTSNNYKIVGGANPKTYIPPVIAPPIADLDYWKTNNLNTHSQINSNKNIDTYLSGYDVSNFCGDNTCPPQKNTSKYTQFKQEQEHVYNKKHNNKYHDKYNNHQKKTHAHLKENFQIENFQNNVDDDFIENFGIDEFGKKKYIIENTGYVNKECNYDKNQFVNNGIPVNMKAGNCQKNSKLKGYNKNLFTQIIQPGVYSVNQVNEPINSNIGISYDQQFEPLSVEENEFGVTFTEHDPLNYDGENILHHDQNEVIEPMTQSNVYDPRFTGYGTSYRAYTDNNLGQTKFYYDDVDAVRMPNYIVRSKIDAFDFADKYDTMDNEYGNVNNSNIRAMANQQFLDDAMTFRTGMQERLMRKTNAEGWQQRMRPIRTGGQRMFGGKNFG